MAEKIRQFGASRMGIRSHQKKPPLWERTPVLDAQVKRQSANCKSQNDRPVGEDSCPRLRRGWESAPTGRRGVADGIRSHREKGVSRMGIRSHREKGVSRMGIRSHREKGTSRMGIRSHREKGVSRMGIRSHQG